MPPLSAQLALLSFPLLPSNKARRRGGAARHKHCDASATARRRQLLHTIISISYSRLVIVVDTRELKLAALLPRNPHRSKKHFLVYLKDYFSFQVCLYLPASVAARQNSIIFIMELAPRNSGSGYLQVSCYLYTGWPMNNQPLKF